MLHFLNAAEEAEGIADLVEWLTTSRNVTPLLNRLDPLRTDYQGCFTSGLKAKFNERAIPVADSSEVDHMISVEENRRLLAIVRLATNPTDLLRVAHFDPSATWLRIRFGQWYLRAEQD